MGFVRKILSLILWFGSGSARGEESVREDGKEKTYYFLTFLLLNRDKHTRRVFSVTSLLGQLSHHSSWIRVTSSNHVLVRQLKLQVLVQITVIFFCFLKMASSRLYAVNCIINLFLRFGIKTNWFDSTTLMWRFPAHLFCIKHFHDKWTILRLQSVEFWLSNHEVVFVQVELMKDFIRSNSWGMVIPPQDDDEEWCVKHAFCPCCPIKLTFLCWTIFMSHMTRYKRYRELFFLKTFEHAVSALLNILSTEQLRQFLRVIFHYLDILVRDWNVV